MERGKLGSWKGSSEMVFVKVLLGVPYCWWTFQTSSKPVDQCSSAELRWHFGPPRPFGVCRSAFRRFRP